MSPTESNRGRKENGNKKNAKAVEWRTFSFVVRQSTDYLNYNLLRLRGHILFINITFKRPNYTSEG